MHSQRPRSMVMFHYCQAVYRKVASLGLTTAYKENGSVHTIIKQLLALPHLPRRHITPAFEEIRGQVQNSPVVESLFEYVDRTWMKSTVWSVGNICSYRRVIRTNNDCEGWHRRLNYRTGRENLPIYTLINVLHREASLVNLTLQLVAEHSLSSTRRKGSKDHQVNLHKLWGEYGEKKISTKQFLMSCKKMLPF